MRKISLLLVPILALSLACAKEKSGAFNIPENYRKWKKPVKKILDYEVPGHGKSYRVIYASKEAFAPTRTKRDGIDAVIMKTGSIIIKESYLKRKDVGTKNYRDLTIMVKDPGNPDALEGWVYYMKKKGKPPVTVTGRMCIGCHEAANDPHPYFDGNKKKEFRDYLFAPFSK